MNKQYYVYIMTNKHNTVLYTGVTNDLWRRVSEHKAKLHGRFTSRYNIDKMVYYEVFNDINVAIAREKQIKAGSRQKKIDLIAKENPKWQDLFQEWVGDCFVALMLFYERHILKSLLAMTWRN